MLANLFLHYAFDRWMDREHPDEPFARYVDDAVVHCSSMEGALKLRDSLELHPTKTRIVYCKDDDRRGDCPETKFDFLGYTFRPRRSKNRYGRFFINFTPAVSNKALEDLARMFNPVKSKMCCKIDPRRTG